MHFIVTTNRLFLFQYFCLLSKCSVLCMRIVFVFVRQIGYCQFSFNDGCSIFHSGCIELSNGVSIGCTTGAHSLRWNSVRRIENAGRIECVCDTNFVCDVCVCLSVCVRVSINICALNILVMSTNAAIAAVVCKSPQQLPITSFASIRSFWPSVCQSGMRWTLWYFNCKTNLMAIFRSCTMYEC